MATLDDILTTQKNGVIGINNLSLKLNTFYDLYAYNSGTLRSATVTSRTQIATGPGRLVSINIVTAGSTVGAVHDAILLSVTGATGDGVKATLTYSPPYTTNVNDTAIVTGVDPAGYNTTGAAITDVVSTGSFKYANTTISAYVSGGVIFVSKASEKISSLLNTAGSYVIGAPFSTGLVIDPGTGQAVNVVYSLG